MWNKLRALAVCCVVVGIATSGCSRSRKGTVVSVPMSITFSEAVSGQINTMKPAGDTLTIRLEDGTEVEAQCTREQIEQALQGETKATIEPAGDGKWMVTALSK